MLNKFNVLCTICARGGSKGVPKKALVEISGKPLLAYSIEQAKAANIFSAIAVSSDSEEILNVAKEYGADILVKRPDNLASDIAPKLPAIIHAVEYAEKQLNIKHDILVDLDVTSPLRLPQDIIGAIELLIKSQAPNVITGCKARRSPYFNLVEECQDGTVTLCKEKASSHFTRRQDVPICYDMNASIYVWKHEALLKETARVLCPGTKLFEMPEERSIDIDTLLDLKIVTYLIENNIS